MHLQRPQISIVIPTLNRATWLGQALQSALAQTRHPGIEVVVVDNASTDNTWDVIQAFCNGAVRAIKNAHTLNICDNWQSALEAARGDYVLILGDDDCLFPQWGEVMLKTLNQAMQQGNAPSFIAWNHITYITKNPLSDTENMLSFPSKLTGTNSTVNGKSLRNAYLRQSSSHPFPTSPHPSLILFNRKQIDAVCNQYNTRWFDGLYPDYHAGILAGDFTTEGIFINQALVCIGAVEQCYYCRKKSKMKRFNDGSPISKMPDINDGFGNHSPYLSLNIARQMVYSCRIASHPINEQTLLKQFISETIENIWFCECVFGKGSHKKDLDNLAQRFGQDTIKELLKRAQKKLILTQLNYFLTKFGTKFNLKLRKTLSKSTIFVAPNSVKNIQTAINWFLKHSKKITER